MGIFNMVVWFAICWFFVTIYTVMFGDVGVVFLVPTLLTLVGLRIWIEESD